MNVAEKAINKWNSVNYVESGTCLQEKSEHMMISYMSFVAIMICLTVTRRANKGRRKERIFSHSLDCNVEN